MRESEGGGTSPPLPLRCSRLALLFGLVWQPSRYAITRSTFGLSVYRQ